MIIERCSDDRLEMWQPRCFSIKCQCMRTTSPGVQRTYQGILELSSATLESKNSLEDLLFVLNFKGIRGEEILEMSGDFRRILLQEAAQDPDNFQHGNQTKKSPVLFTQLSIDDLVRLTCLLWIVLKQVAQDNVRIQADQRRC